MELIVTLNVRVVYTDQEPDVHDDGAERSVAWSRDPETFSKDMRAFLEEYVGEEGTLYWIPLRSAPDRRWPNAPPKVADCVLWVAVECARLGMTVNPSTSQYGDGEDVSKVGNSSTRLLNVAHLLAFVAT